jgi:hypothetical protein
VSDSVLLIIVSALINGAVTWGVVSTKLTWLRRDVDAHDSRLTHLERTR